MRNATATLFTVLFCWGGISCTKGGGNIYVEGYVINPVTGEGIPNATVILRKASSGGAPGAQSAGFKTVKTVTTDANGYYELSHATILTKPYYVRVEEPSDQEYYKIGFAENESGVPVGNSQFLVDKGKNIYVDYEMVPFTCVKFNINNVNCQGPNDNFKLFYEGCETGYHNDLAGLAREGNGCYSYQQDKCTTAPVGKTFYRYEVTRSGVTETFYDTIILVEGQDYVYNINY